MLAPVAAPDQKTTGDHRDEYRSVNPDSFGAQREYRSLLERLTHVGAEGESQADLARAHQVS